jgi:two-component system sensor histidine kinase AlgZ
MKRTSSINQIITHTLLPNFRNLGTVLRTILLVNAIALFVALTQADTFPDFFKQILYGSALLQPVLLASLLVLYALNPMFAKINYWQSATAIVALIALVTFGLDIMGGELFASQSDVGSFRYIRHTLESAIVILLLLSYFRWRALALSPAKQAARLQALQARIRPHFLFNSINAVLAIVRADPKRAETALEDMSDLFRMAMSEPHELVELDKEIQLARQYLALERLRLGERLQVQWNTDKMPPDALIPPLVLQPLLENAVYHGIEPLTDGGIIEVKIYCEAKELHLQVGNPVSSTGKPHNAGHKMALSNIRERLSLLFDVEAEYQVERDANYYSVHILIPYITETV